MSSRGSAYSSELDATEGVAPQRAMTGNTERDALPEARRDKKEALPKSIRSSPSHLDSILRRQSTSALIEDALEAIPDE